MKARLYGKAALLTLSAIVIACGSTVEPEPKDDYQPPINPADTFRIVPGPDELDFFLGDWSIQIFDTNGNLVGLARTHADTILDGTAIQDDWASVDGAGRVVFRGSSIRRYQPDTEDWAIHWMRGNSPGYTYIRAELTSDFRLRGEGAGFDPTGPFIERYEYYDITLNSYRFWRQESRDGGQTWTPRNDVRATRTGS